MYTETLKCRGLRPLNQSSYIKDSNIFTGWIISFPSKILQNGDIFLEESEDQHSETQTPQSDCSQLQGEHSFFPHPGTSVQTQLLGIVLLLGRQENQYFRRTAAGIHIEIVLSYAALMGRVGSTEGKQGAALSTTKPPDRRKNFK